ncbi:hypothetical protein IQ07DRAFT_666331 [Pyrenochaeta sp. DS3sAY3a]|nr:hypothetical protein IQ07DRAFT_666331 [Pyrenochaeta sp. DS3sAY3a]
MQVVYVGDVMFPVSPHTAYRMGIAIEDSYHLKNFLNPVDLQGQHAIIAGFQVYEKQRIDFVNQNGLSNAMEFGLQSAQSRDKFERHQGNSPNSTTSTLSHYIKSPLIVKASFN